MFSLFLQFLKIFGILILVLISLLILTILIPVKVNVKAEYFKNLKLDLKFKFLLGVKYSFNNFESLKENSSIKIFGLDILKLKKIFKVKKNNFNKKKDFSKSNKEFFEDEPNNLQEQKYFKKRHSRSIEKQNFIKNKFKSIGKIDLGIIKELFAFISKLFKVIKIKNLKAKVVYDLKDPYLTGATLGFFNIIIPFLPYEIQILSNFDEEDLKLNIDFEGKISLFKLIVYIISFLSKKSVRKIIFGGV